VRDAAALSCLELADLPPGRVLDVGCGNGEGVSRLAELGWTPWGVEPDAKASAAAARRGVRIAGPTIESCAERDFDAVVLSHVIEHVPDAPAFLRACAGRLRPGGRLVALTPNAESWGYRRFRGAWRGLEPPRHLTLYAVRSLGALASRSGLEIRSLRTSARAAFPLWRDSVGIETKRSRRFGPEATLQGRVAQVVEQVAVGLGLSAGEELVLVAERPPTTR
jgi:SAM-dependent methyltransferase